MRVGTKSVLFGVHSVLLHPWFVAFAFLRLYGFPWYARLWFAFLVHDLGYLHKREMEGSEGERHVELGGGIMRALFGPEWGAFTLAHSRYWAKRNGQRYSRLCVADKLTFVLTPPWLYLPMARATGELWEYMQGSAERQAGGDRFTAEESVLVASSDPHEWLKGLQSYTRRWVEQHRQGCADTWTVAESAGHEATVQ